MEERAYAKRRLILQPGDGWREVRAPIECDYFNLRNAGASIIEMSTDPGNPESFDEVKPDAQAGVDRSQPVPTSRGYKRRFDTGDYVLHIRVTAGVGDARFSFC